MIGARRRAGGAPASAAGCEPRESRAPPCPVLGDADAGSDAGRGRGRHASRAAVRRGHAAGWAGAQGGACALGLGV